MKILRLRLNGRHKHFMAVRMGWSEVLASARSNTDSNFSRIAFVTENPRSRSWLRRVRIELCVFDHLLLVRRQRGYDGSAGAEVAMVLHMVDLNLLLGKHAADDRVSQAIHEVFHFVRYVNPRTLQDANDARADANAVDNAIVTGRVPQIEACLDQVAVRSHGHTRTEADLQPQAVPFPLLCAATAWKHTPEANIGLADDVKDLAPLLPRHAAGTKAPIQKGARRFAGGIEEASLPVAMQLLQDLARNRHCISRWTEGALH